VAEGVKRVDTVVYDEVRMMIYQTVRLVVKNCLRYCQQKGILRVCKDVMVRVLFSFSCQVFL
jgi:hypothetical protein